MNASPFRVTAGPFVEVPVPVPPSSLSEVKKNLEDVPFNSETPELENRDYTAKRGEAAYSVNRVQIWFQRLLGSRGGRRMREEQLAAELQDLRASYAGLLSSTEDIREKLEQDSVGYQSITKALSPFPSAVAGIGKLQERQKEDSEILGDIRERIDAKDNRDATLLASMDTIQGGVGSIQSEVKTVTHGLADLAEKQLGAVASLGDLGSQIDNRLKKAEKAAEKNADRMEQSSDDVLQVLRQMERNGQRGVWIFATLLAVLFVALLCFSAKVSQVSSRTVTEDAPVERTNTEVSGSESLAAQGSEALFEIDF